LAFDDTGVHGFSRRSAQGDSSEAGLDLADGVPTEHGSSVSERDAADRGVEVGVDPQIAAHDERFPRIGVKELDYGFVGDFACDLFEYGAEQVLLAVEMVVQRPLGDAGAGDDVLGSRCRKTSVAEELPGGGEQRGASRRTLGDSQRGRHHAQVHDRAATARRRPAVSRRTPRDQ
jgi:hypothetical protein